MNILVTGANGQLGKCLQFFADKFPQLNLIFLDSKALDITKFESCQAAFNLYKPTFCINTAAYTAVDLAETEQHQADLVNHIGVENLAKVSKAYETTIIHVSTDYVFDGSQSSAYKESDQTNPISVYGKTKLLGEISLANHWHKHLIVRTSWVYSNVGKNFYLSMLNLAKIRPELNIVNDQIGSPTNAYELANALLKIVCFLTKNQDFNNYGLYHYTQKGSCSWYEFAIEIFKRNNVQVKVNPIPTAAYPTPAKRPAFSLLDVSKIESTFELNILNWQDALKKLVLNKS
jgi:dTDP-4-dehydrorhamnose reductase